jgi:hypothetical protein
MNRNETPGILRSQRRQQSLKRSMFIPERLDFGSLTQRESRHRGDIG